MLSSLLLAVLLAACSLATAFAAESVDWSENKITVQGAGVAPANTVSAAQALMLARRAAVVDAYRQLAETVKGVNVNAETTVENMMVTSDVVNTKVSAFVQGARIVSEDSINGAYVVTMEAPLFGVSSLAGVVLEKPDKVESFPAPDMSVAPSAPTSVSVNVQVTTPSTAPSTTPSSTTPNSSTASAPSGKAVGNFTGLIVDCRGLGLKPSMSPVIKNANGQPIYGYKNLDYDAVVANGMAGYTSDIKKASRAGESPLVVKAVRLESGGNPVLSVADANRVLIENGASGFLDRTAVVFVR